MYTNGKRPGQSGAVLLLFYFCPHTFSPPVAGASCDSVAPVDSCWQITRCPPPPVHLVKVNCCGVWAISGHRVHPCTTNTTSAGTDQYCVRPERSSQSQACRQWPTPLWGSRIKTLLRWTYTTCIWEQWPQVWWSLFCFWSQPTRLTSRRSAMGLLLPLGSTPNPNLQRIRRRNLSTLEWLEPQKNLWLVRMAATLKMRRYDLQIVCGGNFAITNN